MFLPRQVSLSVDRIARQAVGKDWGLYAALLDHWQEIVGADFASVTTPVKITFPHQPNEARRRNGTLVIRLPKGLAMEFTFKTDIIRQRINNYFGYDAIGKIGFDPVFGVPVRMKTNHIPDLKELAAIRDEISSVESDDLREALGSFAVAMRGSRRD